MRVLKVIGAVIVILIVIFVIAGLLLPSTYSVERSIVIDATPAEIHEYVGDLNKWEEWEPWTEADPSIDVTRGYKTTGVGANQTRTGDSGNGTLEFIMSSPETGIEYDLVFDGQFESRSAILYEPAKNGGTEVTWIMSGDTEKPVIGGDCAVMIDVMAGDMFEKGLSDLKQVVESGNSARTDR